MYVAMAKYNTVFVVKVGHTFAGMVAVEIIGHSKKINVAGSICLVVAEGFATQLYQAIRYYREGKRSIGQCIRFVYSGGEMDAVCVVIMTTMPKPHTTHARGMEQS